jgi:hypothetical protein
MKLTPGILVLALFIFSYNALAHAQAKPKKDSSQKAGSTNQTTYSPNDVLPEISKGKDLLDIYTPDGKASVAKLFDDFIAAQSNGYDLLSTVLSPKNPARLPSNGDVVIIHAVSWGLVVSDEAASAGAAYQPLKGAWAFCRNTNKGKDSDTKRYCHQDHDLSGDPYLYDAPHIYFIDLNSFPDAVGATKGKFAYQITTTARQKENASSVATLVSALLKVSPAKLTEEIAMLNKPETPKTIIAQVWGTTVTVKASSPLPYDLAISATFTANKGDESDISCEKSACSFSKTVAHYDPEYWDVSLGVSIPGVLEPKYTSTGTLTTPTRHTDAYAFLDLYPLQYFAQAPTTLTSIPHFNLGIPITSQSLHRPYVGLAENLGFLTKRIKLNIPLAVFAGPVFMKQQVYVPAIPGLKSDHAIKMMYGFELPISAITKYMKGGSGSSNSGKSGSQNNGGS